MEIDELIDAFEAGSIAADEFPHERHVRVAWGLARRHGREDGLRRMIEGIKGITARAERPDAYHDTITRAWFELVSSVDNLDDHAELFDKRLLGRFFSPERLATGRSAWVEPDLHPLVLPLPASAGVALAGAYPLTTPTATGREH